MDVVAVVMVVALAFVVGGLRKRIGTLENMVLRLQDRVTDLGGRVPSSAPAAAPIDIEQFVD